MWLVRGGAVDSNEEKAVTTPAGTDQTWWSARMVYVGVILYLILKTIDSSFVV